MVNLKSGTYIFQTVNIKLQTPKGTNQKEYKP